MRRLGRIAWFVILVFSVGVISFRLMQGNPLETDFLALLPDDQQDSAIRQASDHMKEAVTQRVVFLVKSKSFEETKQAASRLVKELAPFATIEQKQNDWKKLGQKLFPYRAGLLSAQDRHLLETAQGGQISRNALVRIMSPFAGFGADLIAKDPYLLFPSYLAEIATTHKDIKTREGWLLSGDYILLIFKLKNKAFDNHFQQKFIATLDEIHFDQKTEVLKTGAVFYAQKGAEQAEREATVIGLVSLCGIVLLNFIVFRSIRPILLSLFAIASGVTGGFGITLFIFGQLHLMAFVFGAGLIGIAVDYTFHYVCAVGENAEERTKDIARPLTFGVMSSVFGFLVLATAPFPGLQQIAIFAASGLVMAYLCVMAVYPQIDKAASSNLPLQRWKLSPVFVKLTGGGCLVVAMIGFGQFHVDDNIRKLQNLPADLKVQEDRIRQLTGMDNTIRVLLVCGLNEERLLQREEKLLDILSNLKNQGVLANYTSLTQTIPSQKRQKENRELVRQNLLGEPLTEHQRMLGLVEDATVYESPGYVLPDGLFEELRLSDQLHLVRINGVSDPQKLEKTIMSFEGVDLLDQAKHVSETLGKYRERALVLISIACVVILLFLLSRYGWRDGFKIWMVPVFATLVTPFIGAAMGESFTFFNAMALLLVLAIGLDYALFNFEASGCEKSRAVLANALSAVSTILAFGLLSFSDLYAIHAFGLTVLIGIVVAFAMASLAQRNIRKNANDL